MEELVKFIALFNSFCTTKHIFTDNIFSINASLLQKLKNKIPSHTFPLETIPPVFNQVKLVLYENKNA